MAFGKNVDLANLSVLSVDLDLDSDFDFSSSLIEDMENDDLFESKSLSFEPVNKDYEEIAKMMADLNMDASNDKENENEVTILKKREKKRVTETKVAQKLSAFTATTKTNTTFTVTNNNNNDNKIANAGRETNSVDGFCIGNDTTTSMSERKGIYDRGGDEDEDDEEVEEIGEKEDTNLMGLKMDDVSAAAAIEQHRQQVLMKLLRTIVYDNMLSDQEKIILIVKLIRDDDDGISYSHNKDNNDTSNKNTERSRSVVARINNNSNELHVRSLQQVVDLPFDDGISPDGDEFHLEEASVGIRTSTNSETKQDYNVVNNATTTNTVIAFKTTSSNDDIYGDDNGDTDGNIDDDIDIDGDGDDESSQTSKNSNFNNDNNNNTNNNSSATTKTSVQTKSRARTSSTATATATVCNGNDTKSKNESETTFTAAKAKADTVDDVSSDVDDNANGNGNDTGIENNSAPEMNNTEDDESGDYNNTDEDEGEEVGDQDHNDNDESDNNDTSDKTERSRSVAGPKAKEKSTKTEVTESESDEAEAAVIVELQEQQRIDEPAGAEASATDDEEVNDEPVAAAALVVQQQQQQAQQQQEQLGYYNFRGKGDVLNEQEIATLHTRNPLTAEPIVFYDLPETDNQYIVVFPRHELKLDLGQKDNEPVYVARVNDTRVENIIHEGDIIHSINNTLLSATTNDVEKSFLPVFNNAEVPITIVFISSEGKKEKKAAALVQLERQQQEQQIREQLGHHKYPGMGVVINEEDVKKDNKIMADWPSKHVPKFCDNFKALQKFKKDKGNLNVPLVGRKDAIQKQVIYYRSLNSNREEKELKSHELTALATLNDIGFIWDLNSYNWNEFYFALLKHRVKHGNVGISYQKKIKKEKNPDQSLGLWWMRIPEQYKSLSDVQKKKLKTVGYIHKEK